MQDKIDEAVEIGEYQVYARCLAGVESCCYIDSLDIAFDIGCVFGKVQSKSNIFITHGHIDHINAFMTHAGRRSLVKSKPATYYVPNHLKERMENIQKEFCLMQEDTIPAIIVGLSSGDEIQISNQWVVKAFSTCHRVPSLGYILYRKHTKLKEEYVGMEGKKLGQLRKDGVDILNEVRTPEIAYTGDTTIDLFLDPERIDFLRVKLLITETTYIDDKNDSNDAYKRGHIHIDHIIQHANHFEQVGTLLLVHFSARYNPSLIESLIMEKLPESMKEKVKVAPYPKVL